MSQCPKFVTEGLVRRFVSRAFTWCCIEAVGDAGESDVAQSGKIGCTGKISPNAPVGIFDGSFLPRRSWAAKPGFGSEEKTEFPSTSELDTLVEREASPRFFVQWEEGVGHGVQHRARLKVIIPQQGHEPGFALDHRTEIAFAVLLAKLDQIAFPGPGFVATTHTIGTFGNMALSGFIAQMGRIPVESSAW